MDTHYVFEWIEETTSTQDEARLRFGGRPVVVAAGRQSRGRGRGQRGWDTAPRALAISLCWKPGWEASSFGLLPLVAGLAATDVVDARLKWPNDVINDLGEKLGGILAESSGDVVTIGLGLNLYWPQSPSGYGAVYEEDPGRCEDLATGFATRLIERTASGSESWDRDAYLVRCATINRSVTWEPSGSGRAVGIGDGGELVVETDEGTRSLITGEVWQVRTAGS